MLPLERMRTGQLHCVLNLCTIGSHTPSNHMKVDSITCLYPSAFSDGDSRLTDIKSHILFALDRLVGVAKKNYTGYRNVLDAFSYATVHKHF